MKTQEVLGRRPFKNLAGVAAISALAIAVTTAIVSASARPWWDTYLQGLSVTFVDVCATVFIVDVLLNRQTARLSATLRQNNEIAALAALRNFVGLLRNAIPQSWQAIDVHQLQWLGRHLSRVRTLCDGIAPGSDDPPLQISVDEFRIAELAWSQAFEYLEYRILRAATADEQTTALTDLTTKSERLREISISLICALSERLLDPAIIPGMSITNGTAE
jgi:hypothetical protein